MINKPVRIIFINEAQESFKRLNEIVSLQIQSEKEGTFEMKLLDSIKKKIDLIKSNPFYGDNIKKELIPKKLMVPNLWRVELFNYWRMLYTIRGDEVEIVCFILEFMDHPNYDKIFGYRKK